MNMKKRLNKGFTLTELIVVIAIIGVLAAIAILSYDAVVQRASDTSVLADMDRMKDLQGIYGLDHGISGGKDYDSTQPDSEIVFTASDGNTINVSADSSGYCIRGYSTKGTKTTISDSFELGSSPTACASHLAYSPPTCPTGFIVVPGDSTYGTSDFCVMKYEAKNVSGVATSVAAGSPWTNTDVEWSDAKVYAEDACEGCHLITEAEWMTIAKNVASVASNWTGGAVGSGMLYNGHNDNAPISGVPLTGSSTDDNDGYYLTGNVAPSSQRRTLKLTNNETIWDFAGNAAEWVDASIGAGLQPGWAGEVIFNQKDWNDATINWNGLAYNSRPVSTGLTGAATWDSSKGIGELYSNLGYASSRVYIRGGAFDHGDTSGVFALKLHYGTTGYCVHFGFRVAK